MKRTYKVRELLSLRIMKEIVGIYLFLFFVIYPLYYEDHYYNMGDAKWHFFKSVTYFSNPGGLWFPGAIIFFIACFIWYQVDLYRKGEIASYWNFKKTSVTDRFVLGYLIITVFSTIISPYKDSIIWGYKGWYMGLIAQIAFVLLYYFVSRFWRWDDLMITLYLGVSAVVFFLGVLHRFHIDPLDMYNGLDEKNIHEFLSPFDDPQKIIDDTVDHYGYLYENEEAVQKKFKRNSELLLKMIENKDTATPLTYLQLYETFILAERYEEAMQYIDEGIECARKRNNNCLAVLYYQKAITFYKYKKYNEILKVYNDYFNMSKVIRPKELSTDGEMYAVMAEAFYLTGRYDEAIKEYKKFFEIYPKIASGKLVTNDAFLTSSSFCADVMIIPLFNDFLDCCIHSEKYNTAESQMMTLPLYRYEAAQKHIVRLVRQEIAVLDKLDYKSAAKVYERLNDDCKNAFIIYLVSEVISSQKKTEIIKALSVMSKADKEITNALNAAEIIVGAVDLRSQKKYKECISEMKRAVTIYEL